MRDRKLTGPWAGFSFKGGRLVTPEGRELEPQDLAWLSLTAAQAQEWRRLMEGRRRPAKPRPFSAASVVSLADAIAERHHSDGIGSTRSNVPSAPITAPGVPPLAILPPRRS